MKLTLNEILGRNPFLTRWGGPGTVCHGFLIPWKQTRFSWIDLKWKINSRLIYSHDQGVFMVLSCTLIFNNHVNIFFSLSGHLKQHQEPQVQSKLPQKSLRTQCRTNLAHFPIYFLILLYFIVLESRNLPKTSKIFGRK